MQHSTTDTISFQNVYFLGIGGIGMSAIARYYNAKHYAVAGYDRTRSTLCQTLEQEGIAIHYEISHQLIPNNFRPDNTLVVYTPAVATSNEEYVWLQTNGYVIKKRAAVLGEITKVERGLCVAGTHGKTTISTMLAHLLKQSHVDCNAFLGGLSKNYDGNLLLSEHSDLVVIEADEFDRSFHQLSPYMAVVSAVDADHLDIYGTHEAYLEAFAHFTSLIQPGGCLLMKHGIALQPQLNHNVKCYTYSGSDNDNADFYATNIHVGIGELHFDFVSPFGVVRDVELGVPVTINVENGVAAMAIAMLNGVEPTELKNGMRSFRGVKRRFDVQLKTEKLTIIDDYAHHPAELEASIRSVIELYRGKKVLGVFQPHLYTRTRDFYSEFAAALSLLDEVVLVELYPAREEPIENISSETIYNEVTCKKTLTTKKELIQQLQHKTFDVLLTLGAGDLDTMLPQICDALK
ncbi:MAG: UDP-N-acetylmuramate--L-alanine ligase [Bacteroidales bacterium]|nr:UDP-N-acetylmuramate--L-alanine ligase [Bacteroidales bacterium]